MTPYESVRSEYGAALARVAASYTVPGPDREDLEQEIALAVFHALGDFRGESSLRTYVFRIAHNCGVRHIAQRRPAAVPVEDEDTMASDADPEREVMAKTDVARLLGAIRELPLGQRQALTLALEGLRQSEIGDVLGIPENAVAVRLHRARAALRDQLGHPGEQQRSSRPQGQRQGVGDG